MALWGNNDSVAYLYQGAVGGTVSVNYSTKVVTGTGTTFGSDGYAKEGDVIRIGFRGTGGTYFGDATITSIASTTSLTIASTDGLSGAAIANTSYWVSELPQYTPQNPRYSEDPTFNRETQGFKQIFTGTASTFAGIGVSVLPVNLTQAEIDGNVAAGDFILVDGESIEITGIATANVRVSGTQSIGTTRYYVKAGDDGLPALSVNSAGLVVWGVRIVRSKTNVITIAAIILIPISPTQDNKIPDNNTPIIAEGTAAILPHFATWWIANPDFECARLLPKLTIKTNVKEATNASLISQSSI